MTSSDRERRVVLAMLTFRRPGALQRVLPLLLEQAATISPVARVVVVDNDPDAGAKDIVHRFGEVTYVHEPVPGLAAARNRALDEAADAQAVVFIDDDELPTEGWLAALVDRWIEWGCAAVTGPVQPELVTPPSAWLKATGMYSRTRNATGTSLPGAATNNLLIDLDVARRLGLRFDAAFGLTGGEDTMFTHALVHRGEQIRWCDEAVVREPVPTDRVTRRWAMTRTYRAGTSWSRVGLALATSRTNRLATRAELTARGLVRIITGSVQIVRGVILRRVEDRAQGTVTVVSHAGLLSGAYGLTHAEYRRG